MKEKIHRLRSHLGLSQAEFGRKVYVSRQTVSNWERGKTQPDLASLKRLAKIYELPLSYFTDEGKEILDPPPLPKQKISWPYYLFFCFSFLVPGAPFILIYYYREEPLPISYKKCLIMVGFIQLIILTGLTYRLIELAAISP